MLNLKLFIISTAILGASLVTYFYVYPMIEIFTRLPLAIRGLRSIRNLSSKGNPEISNIMAADRPTISYVTAPNEEIARTLARRLVEDRLAACVNIVRGVESIYEWNGKIENDNEILMIIKSNSKKSTEITKFIEENHPYDCPEVVTLEINSGSKKYLDWIHETLNKQPVDTTKPKDAE